MFWSFRLIDIHKDQFYVRRIFGDDLSAGTTWGGATFCGDSHFFKRMVARGEGFENGDAFGAAAKTVAGALNVGAVNDRVSIGQERSADLEFGIWRLRMFACFYGFGDDVDWIIHNVGRIR